MTKTKFKNLVFFRSVNAGNSSFALSSSQDIGKLRSITLEFQGSGFYLNDVIVHSVADNKRYGISRVYVNEGCEVYWQ